VTRRLRRLVKRVADEALRDEILREMGRDGLIKPMQSRLEVEIPTAVTLDPVMRHKLVAVFYNAPMDSFVPRACWITGLSDPPVSETLTRICEPLPLVALFFVRDCDGDALWTEYSGCREVWFRSDAGHGFGLNVYAVGEGEDYGHLLGAARNLVGFPGTDVAQATADV